MEDYTQDITCLREQNHMLIRQNENLERMMRERANAERKIPWKKRHSGIIQIKSELVKQDVDLNLRWRSHFQTYLYSSLNFSEVEAKMHRLIKKMLLDCGIELDDVFKIQYRTEDEKAEEKLFVYRHICKLAYRAGMKYWEFSFEHDIELDLPQEYLYPYVANVPEKSDINPVESEEEKKIIRAVECIEDEYDYSACYDIQSYVASGTLKLYMPEYLEYGLDESEYLQEFNKELKRVNQKFEHVMKERANAEDKQPLERKNRGVIRLMSDSVHKKGLSTIWWHTYFQTNLCSNLRFSMIKNEMNQIIKDTLLDCGINIPLVEMIQYRNKDKNEKRKKDTYRFLSGLSYKNGVKYWEFSLQHRIDLDFPEEYIYPYVLEISSGIERDTNA